MSSSPTPVHSKKDILTELAAVFSQSTEYLHLLLAAEYYAGNDEKWSVFENTDHLIRSTKPLTQALGMPKIALRAFGKPNRKGRTYEEVVEKYHQKLKEGGAASGRYVPSNDYVITEKEKTKHIEKWEKAANHLLAAIEKWNDEKLDKYLLPHPLLGKMTIREMLFFTIYHTQHHFNTIQELSASDE